MFNIYLTDEIVPETDPRVTAVYGKIRIGQFSETFVSSLVSWGPDEYRAHWAESLRRLLSGASQSALITSYVKPELSDHLVWWPLYREGEIVYVQNQLLFYDNLVTSFSEENPWASVGQRKTVNAEGQLVSEWTIDADSIRAFLKPGDRRAVR